MSQDIRSFFSVSKKLSSASKSTLPVESSPAAPKRKAIRLSSDEDEVSKTPKEKTKTKIAQKKRRIIDSDDDESDKKSIKSNKKINLSKIKEKPITKKLVDVSTIFGSEPVRVERKKPKKVEQESKETEEDCVMLTDDEFEKTIIELDDELIAKEEKSPKKFIDQKSSKDTPEKANKDKSGNKLINDDLHEKKKEKPLSNGRKSSPEKNNLSPEKKISEDSDEKIKRSDIKTSHSEKSKSSPEKPKTKLMRDNASVERTHEDGEEHNYTPKTKSMKTHDLDSSVLSDEDRFERKRMSAILYQKYKNRTSVINPGCKEVPKGKPNCLAGLSFLVTGILESIEREEANTLIKELGGKISTVVGKKLKYLVVGEEAGLKKLATAEELGTKILTEDGLFDLIREKSGETKKIKESPNKQSEKKSPHKRDKSKDKEKRPEKHKIKDEKHEQIKKPKLESPDKIKKIKNETVTSGFLNNKNEDYAHGGETEIKQEFDENLVIKKEKTAYQKDIASEENKAWVDKYKPTSIKQIIGQQGAASNCVKLTNWLSKWHSNHDGKKKLQKPNPWAKNDDGGFYKAALLSGPPGVGKTTTATLVCKELGYDAVEFNASDTRSKRLLKEEVSELLSNKSLFGYFHGGKQAVSKKHVLIMDEVDGMAGNEDRGGIQELIGLIKESHVPIICMCNDRNHQKMRSLVNYCYDLRFNKPRLEQIKGPIMSICFKEKYKLPPNKIEEVILATNNDIRQTLNHLSLLAAGKDLELKENKNTASKDMKLGPWEVVRKVFSADVQKTMSLMDRSDLFFHDYSLGPLFVQQNYLSVAPHVPKSQIPEQVALAADSLSCGDLIEKRIRSNSAWALLPTQAMFSSVMPGTYMSGHFTGQINFPGWLGKNSKSNKRSRLAQEIHDHTRIRTSGSRLSIRLDYAPFLLAAIVQPLKERGLEGVEDSLTIIKEYRLLREDIDSLIELTSWPGKKSPMDSIEGKIKAALTRAYNKEVLAYSYSATAAVKKKKSEISDELEIHGDDEEPPIISDNEEDDNLENDALIKAKKKPASKGPSTSAGKGESKRGGPSTSSKGRGGKSKK